MACRAARQVFNHKKFNFGKLDAGCPVSVLCQPAGGTAEKIKVQLKFQIFSPNFQNFS